MGSRTWPPSRFDPPRRPTTRAGREAVTRAAAKLAKIATSQPWRDQAACAGIPDGLAVFFPERGEVVRAATAKLVCAGCPVQRECLRYALTTPKELEGIWGGLSPKQRRNPLKIAAVLAEEEACST